MGELDGVSTKSAAGWRAALREARDERRLTRAELAGRCGISVSALRAYESGTRHPSRRTLQAIVDALGLPADRANPVFTGAGYAADTRAITRLGPLLEADMREELRDRPWPAFITNQAFDVVRSNPPFDRAFGVAPGDPGDRSFLAGLSDERFASRLRNWDEVVAYIVGLAKGDPRWEQNLESPLAWIAPGIDRFSSGSPARIRRFVALWDSVAPILPRLRYSYRIEWTAPDATELSFWGLTMVTDLGNELHWNEWLPASRTTWEWFED